MAGRLQAEQSTRVGCSEEMTYTVAGIAEAKPDSNEGEDGWCDSKGHIFFEDNPFWNKDPLYMRPDVACKTEDDRGHGIEAHDRLSSSLPLPTRIELFARSSAEPTTDDKKVSPKKWHRQIFRSLSLRHVDKEVHQEQSRNKGRTMAVNADVEDMGLTATRGYTWTGCLVRKRFSYECVPIPAALSYASLQYAIKTFRRVYRASTVFFLAI